MRKWNGLPRFVLIAGPLFWMAMLAPACRLNASSGMGGLPRGGIQQTYGTVQEPFWAEHGRLTLGFQLGYGLENSIPHDISHINMMIAEPQVGIIAWDSPHSRLPVKRFEIISEGILGTAYRPGGYLVGNSLLLRFSLQPVDRAVPFIDAGSGPLRTTLNKDAVEITGHVQFLSQGGVGVQYFFKLHHALVLEYRYFHMSNGGLQEPNYGFNGSMVTIGFCWLGRPHHLIAATTHGDPFHFLHLR
ncbi:MAG: acyloxyacyl hydrolase [Acidobacteria bacterium]|nr:acyloxyacyl hydrolase [Acidobacteriota bacterium]